MGYACEDRGQAAANFLSLISGLKSLTICNYEADINQMHLVPMLSRSIKLEKINFWPLHDCFPISPQAMDSVTSLPLLQSIQINSQYLHESDYAKLKQCTQLVELVLHNARELTSVNIDEIITLHKLKHVHLLLSATH